MGLLKVGQIVIVPFGKKKLYAIVRGIVKKPTFKTKKIDTILAYTIPNFNLDLLNWMEQFYPYDWGELNKLFIPSNPNVKSRLRQDTKINKATLKLPKPNKDQAQAIQKINKSDNLLLHGVTGSGKTRVYLDIVNTTIAEGKSALLLTPEIGLTPQLIQTVQKYCSAPIITIHSQKTPAQKKAVWEYVCTTKEPFIVIGPRSALFLPYQNLGLIVADESHDQSYKNMSSPRYNGIYVGSKLAKIHKAKFIQCTATPNVADLYMYNQKKLPVVQIAKIAAGELKAVGQIIDINDKNNFTKSPYLSDSLIDSVNDALTKKQQALIFLNKRGSARIIQCQDCSHIAECPNCGLPLTFHHDSYLLKCHLCNFKSSLVTNCQSCNSVNLNYQVPGTKGLEQHINSLFIGKNIARFDLDNADQDNLKNRYDQINKGEIDIILGTQLITKGLDLNNLGVVGVLNADSSLQLPDYRAEEMAFQQLYQVTGRVGRGHINGTYIIQTRNPEHPVMQASLNRDYYSFYNFELAKRKQFNYPPFSYIAQLKITKAKDITAKNKAEQLALKISTIKNINLLGPSPSFYHKNAGQYTWQIILKSNSREPIIQAISLAGSDWICDIDPTNLL
jgi:primosomal protein N' (replication factor Y)